MQTKLCPQCRVAVEADAHFCGACGSPLPEAPKVNPVVPVADRARQPHLSPARGVPVGPGPRPGAPARPVTPPAHAPTPAVVPAVPAPNSGSYNRHPTPISLDRLVGRTLNNRYVVQRKIGEGGFGAVFEGKQVATGRGVALKVLHPHSVADPTVVARFRREAEACSQLRDPHTVTIYDFDQTEDGVLYLAMELVRGESLQDIQRRNGVIQPERALRILDQVVEALGEAHEKGIVHRDMKPENIMVECRDEEDFVKVLDFGIAKIVSGDGAKGAPALTAFGQTVGTLEFMSPEQLRGKPLDGRSDIYALGMVAYEMLTGQLPFKDAKNTTEVIQFHLQDEPPPPSTLRSDLQIPEAVDEIVLKMVAKSRDDRHADAADLRRHIAEALASLDSTPKGRPGVRIAVLVGGVAVLIGAITAAVLHFAR